MELVPLERTPERSLAPSSRRTQREDAPHSVGESSPPTSHAGALALHCPPGCEE